MSDGDDTIAMSIEDAFAQTLADMEDAREELASSPSGSESPSINSAFEIGVTDVTEESSEHNPVIAPPLNSPPVDQTSNLTSVKAPEGPPVVGPPAGPPMGGPPAGPPMSGPPAGPPMSGPPAGPPMVGPPAGPPMMGPPAGPPMVGPPAGPPMMGPPAGPPMSGPPAGPPMSGPPAGPPMVGPPAGPPMMGPPAGPPMSGPPAGPPIMAPPPDLSMGSLPPSIEPISESEDHESTFQVADLSEITTEVQSEGESSTDLESTIEFDESVIVAELVEEEFESPNIPEEPEFNPVDPDDFMSDFQDEWDNSAPVRASDIDRTEGMDW